MTDVHVPSTRLGRLGSSVLEAVGATGFFTLVFLFAALAVTVVLTLADPMMEASRRPVDPPHAFSADLDTGDPAAP